MTPTSTGDGDGDGDGPFVLELANLQRGLEAVGGLLTIRRGIARFTPHRFNVQSAVEEFRVEDVVAAEAGWTRLFGLLPLVPNSVQLTLSDGRRLVFTVWNRARVLGHFGF